MAEFSGLSVLLVEDEGGVALLLETMLEDLGFEVAASVARVGRAFEAIEARRFDLAVLDVNLAGETSFDLARSLLGGRTPVVFSTGYGAAGLPDDLQRCPVLSKPFTQDSLHETIRTTGIGSR
jgi:CheY-like chemotaxis protein